MKAVKLKVTVSGLRELDARLGELSKGVAKGVMRRVLLKAGAPIRDAAAALAPKDTGELSTRIAVGTKIQNTAGNAEYAEVMRSFGTRAEAVAAMRDARRAARGEGSFVEVYVGPAKATSKRGAIKAIAQEFGTVHHRPQPYMRPAFEQKKMAALEVIKTELGGEIDKAARRAARRAARKAGG